MTLIFGGIHGNENAAAEIVPLLAEYLRAHPKELANRSVVLVAQVSPDGVAAHTRANRRGVDLNRNFPTGWKKRPIHERPKDEPGRAPLSEPESAALAKLVDQIKPGKIVAIHTPRRTVNYNGNVGKALAEAMGLACGYPLSADIGYPTPGSFWMYAETSKRIPTVTLELGGSSTRKEFRSTLPALLAAVRFAGTGR